MLALVNDLASINRAPSLRRWPILCAYLRLRTVARVAAYLNRQAFRRVRLFGAYLSFSNYHAALHLFREIFIQQHYHFQASTPNPTIVDCGGNIGISVLYFKLCYPKATVKVFEPDADAFALLERNVEAFGLTGVEIFPLALAAKDGPRDFYCDPTIGGGLCHSLLAERIASPNPIVRQVNAERLSKHLSKATDLLKLDLEGSEHEVLDELASSGSLAAVKSLIIEYHHHISDTHGGFSELLKLLDGAGFSYDVDATRPATRGAYQDLMLYCYRR